MTITIEMTKKDFLKDIEENIEMTTKNIGIRGEKATFVVKETMKAIKDLDFSDLDMLGLKSNLVESFDSEFGEDSMYLADDLIHTVEIVTDLETKTTHALGLGEAIEFNG